MKVKGLSSGDHEFNSCPGISPKNRQVNLMVEEKIHTNSDNENTGVSIHFNGGTVFFLWEKRNLT